MKRKVVSRIGIPNTLTVKAIDRDDNNCLWRLWLFTNDYVFGTFLALHDDGNVQRITVREDEPDDIQDIAVKQL